MNVYNLNIETCNIYTLVSEYTNFLVREHLDIVESTQQLCHEHGAELLFVHPFKGSWDSVLKQTYNMLTDLTRKDEQTIRSAIKQFLQKHQQFAKDESTDPLYRAFLDSLLSGNFDKAHVIHSRYVNKVNICHAKKECICFHNG